MRAPTNSRSGTGSFEAEQTITSATHGESPNRSVRPDGHGCALPHWTTHRYYVHHLTHVGAKLSPDAKRS